MATFTLTLTEAEVDALYEVLEFVDLKGPPKVYAAGELVCDAMDTRLLRVSDLER